VSNTAMIPEIAVIPIVLRVKIFNIVIASFVKCKT